MVGVSQDLKHLALLSGKGPVAVGGLAVVTFAGVAGNREYSDVGGLFLLLDEAAGDLHLRHHGVAKQDAEAVVGGVVAELGLGEGDVLVVPGLDVLVHLESVHAEAFGDVADVCLVDVAGAGAAGDEVVGAGAVEGDLLNALEGQHAVVLQEHEALGGGGTHELGMTGEVGLVAVLVAGEAGGADDVLKHAADVAVQVCFGEAAVLHGGDYALDLVGHAGLHEVVACTHCGHGAFLVAPVGHHDAVEAPLVTQDGGEELVVLLGVDAVDFVVRAHDGPGVGLADGDLEALQVELAEDAGADAGVVAHTVDLLVVGGEMLDGYAHAVALDAAHVGCGHLAGEEGILGEVLEVTAAEGVAVQVLAGSQEHVGAVFLHLLAHGGGELLYEFGVPGRCQHGSHREAGAIESLVGTGTGRVDAEAGRAVGKNRVGNAQAGNGAGGAGSAGNQGCVGSGEGTGSHAAPAAAHHQGGLLFQGHGLKDSVYVVLLQLRLCEH